MMNFTLSLYCTPRRFAVIAGTMLTGFLSEESVYRRVVSKKFTSHALSASPEGGDVTTEDDDRGVNW